MDLDDELCLCFHVTKRKVISYLRHEAPSRPSQLSECYGAGTGCGWCRPYLRQLFEAWQAGQPLRPPRPLDLPDPQRYAEGRAEHIRQGRGTPPPGWQPRKD